MKPSDNRKYEESKFRVTGDVARHESINDDNYSQVADFWTKVLSEPERERLVNNVAGHLKNAQEFLQERAIANFTRVHPDYGQRVRFALKKHKVCS